MVYLTHYSEYPIYHPEEGGYYQAGRQADVFYRLNSVKQAKRKLLKAKKELEADGFVIYNDGESAYRRDKYIGNGEEWLIEKIYASHNEGWRPYE